MKSSLKARIPDSLEHKMKTIVVIHFFGDYSDNMEARLPLDFRLCLFKASYASRDWNQTCKKLLQVTNERIKIGAKLPNSKNRFDRDTWFTCILSEFLQDC